MTDEEQLALLYLVERWLQYGQRALTLSDGEPASGVYAIAASNAYALCSRQLRDEVKRLALGDETLSATDELGTDEQRKAAIDALKRADRRVPQPVQYPADLLALGDEAGTEGE